MTWFLQPEIHIEIKAPPNEFPVSRQRLRHMMKYLAKKKFVCFKVLEQSSVLDPRRRSYCGKIKEWHVTTGFYDGVVPYEYDITVLFEDGSIMEEGCPAEAVFTGLATIRWWNSGPDCWIWADWGAKAKNCNKED